tara:strand:+ start:258 stop:950 length:693 start_codon:yes stop_codon:yes gene_type:complete
MGGAKASGDMRCFQIRISHEQAQHLPGNIITKYFNKVEMVTGTGVVDSIPTCILKVEHDNIDIMSIKDELEGSLIIDALLQSGDGFAYLKARTPGPIQRLIATENEAWIMPPTSLCRENGFSMTIHGTANGLKRIKDNLQSLIPDKMDMRISNLDIGDWMMVPKLPIKRNLVIKTAVEMGYYSTPRGCNQNAIADFLGLKQGTVAEHLQKAEHVIINSWAEQSSQSESSD